jgi:large repetitive protein
VATSGGSDTTSPSGTAISSQTPSVSPTTSTTIQFAFGGATDNVAVTSYECKLDSGAYATCSTPKSYSSLSSGSHTFYVRAKDAAGNVDASPASYTWTVTTSSGTPPTNAPSEIELK